MAYVAPKEHMAITAKNNNQREALRMLHEGRKLVILQGSSGTGKSLVACYRAAKMLREGACLEHIILAKWGRKRLEQNAKKPSLLQNAE